MDLRLALSFPDSVSVEEHVYKREYRKGVDQTCNGEGDVEPSTLPES